MDKYRMNFANKVILFAITAMVVLFSASIVFAGPDQPIEFKGTLQYQGGDDVSAPAEVCAYIDGGLRGNHTTAVDGRYGAVSPPDLVNLVVTGDSTDNGKNITFTVDGVQADPEFLITDWGTNAGDSPYTLNLIISADLPAITDWYNNKTNNNATSITVNESESVRFNVTSDQIITTWRWFKDGVDQSNNFDNYTASWDVNGTYAVSVNATNTNGTSDTKTWTITVNDITAPVISTVTMNTTTPNTGDAILVTVNATDNVAVTNVTAGDVELASQGGNIWNGTITAIVGTHSVNVSAVDAAGNTGWNNSTSYTATEAPVLTTITVDPATMSIVAGGTQTFTATTLDQSGNAIAATVAWSSSNATVGTINANTGVFSAIAAGTTTVNATNGSVTGTAAVTVTAAPVETVNISISLKDSWNLIGIPVNPTNATVASVFAGVDMLGYNVFRFNTDLYVFEVVTTVEPKVGYWVYSNGSCTIWIEGTPVTS